MTPDEELADSPAAQGRHDLALGCQERLMHKAHRALDVHGLDAMDFVVACIAVDTRWRPVVDMLMPGGEGRWQAERDRGAMPVAMGVAMREGFLDRVLADCPELRGPLSRRPDAGSAHLLVLDDTGGSVYDVPARENLPAPRPPS